MNLQFKDEKFASLIKKFQEGGPIEEAPVEEPAQAPTEGGDPMELIVMAAQQALETQDANLAMQVCQAIVQLAGGGAPAEPQAPEGAAPVYKKGGKLSRWIQK